MLDEMMTACRAAGIEVKGATLREVADAGRCSAMFT
jgi:hypothetical protein